MNVVQVQVPQVDAAHYDVRIGPGLLIDLGQMVRAVAPAPSCCIVSDSHVAPMYMLEAVEVMSSAGYRVIEHVIPAGESHKTIQTAMGVMDALLTAKIERATPVIALGGGVVGDLTGFVAATLLRGVPFVQVPTTLLSSVDASVGGKVGVDHAAGKNLIGAFHQPRLVLTDISTFKSLPVKEIRCGLAECIKHAVIRDAGLFEFIGTNLERLLACDGPVMAELVGRNVAIKAAVVQADPFERGVRALLNFGHTFGHAIEKVLGYAGVGHGEAVGLGMVAAGRLTVDVSVGAARGKGGFGPAELAAMIGLIQRAGLPTSWPELDVEATYAAMATDKKVRGGKLRLVLPTRIGDAQVVEGVEDSAIRRAIDSLRAAV